MVFFFYGVGGVGVRFVMGFFFFGFGVWLALLVGFVVLVGGFRGYLGFWFSGCFFLVLRLWAFFFVFFWVFLGIVFWVSFVLFFLVCVLFCRCACVLGLGCCVVWVFGVFVGCDGCVLVVFFCVGGGFLMWSWFFGWWWFLGVGWFGGFLVVLL